MELLILDTQTLGGALLQDWTATDLLLLGIGAGVTLMLMIKTISLYEQTQGLVKLQSEGAAAFDAYERRRPVRIALRYGSFLGLTALFVSGLVWLPAPSNTEPVEPETTVEEATPPEPALDESTVTLLTDEQSLSIGQSIFNSSCAACHGQRGEGGAGPMLTDEEWIHGGTIGEVFKTIRDGVPEKGMIAWEQQLSPENIQQVASYILQMEGEGSAPLSSIE
jgi:mono/diheme cytochrome c family protein